MNGVYFDPAHDGCGLFFSSLADGVTMVAYFGHTHSGSMLWLTGVGDIDKGIPLTLTDGSGFPTQTAVHHEDIGSVRRVSIGNDRVAFEVGIAHEYLGGVLISPPPPAGWRKVVTLNCAAI